MAGVEGGVSLGTAVAAAPSLGGFHGGEIGSLSTSPGMGGTSHSVEIPGFAPVDISPAVTDTRMAGLNTDNPFAGLEMYSPQLDTASVLGADTNATAKSLDGFDIFSDVTSIAEKAWGNTVKDFDIQSAADAVAKAAWDQTAPYSVIEDANKVVEDAVNKSAVHVMSPFEVVGLWSAGAKAQQSLSNESLVEEISPITEVDHPIEFGHEEIMQIESAIEVSPELGLEEVSESVAQQEATVSFSDIAVAQKVAEIAGELGLQDIATEAEHIVSQQTALIENNLAEQTAHAAEAMPVSQLASFSQENIEQKPFSSVALEELVDIEKKGQTGKPNTFEHKELGPVRDEKANGRRREIGADVLSKMVEDSPFSFSSEKLANEFERRAGEDPSAKSEVVREDASSVDGTIADIGDDLRKTSFDTPDAANDAISQAILRNPAVAIRERRELPEEALWKVLRGNTSRRYASLAA